MKLEGGQQSKRAATLVVELVKAFEQSAMKCSLALGDLFLGSPQRVLKVLCGYFAHERREMFGGENSNPLITVAPIVLESTRWMRWVGSFT